MAEVKWIKITTNMFDDEKIKLIEAMPDKDAILIIWVKLLVQAGKCNASGYLLLNQNFPYTDEMLSTVFNRPLNTVRMALEAFKNFGMIDFDDNSFYISNWEKHQNIEGLEKIRGQNRERKQRQRLNQKESLKIEEMSRDSHVTITQSHATEVEVDLDLEVDLEKEVKSSSRPLPKTPEIIYQENIGMLTAHIAERINVLLTDGVTEELLSKYITVAVERGKRNWSYIEKMALGNLEDGITTLVQYEAMNKERGSSTKPKTNENSNPFAKYRKEKGWV